MSRTIFSKLLKLHIITPRGICNLVGSFYRDGISLMALMRFSAIYYPNRCALVSEGKRYTYKEMFDNAQSLAKLLFCDYGLTAGMCVGLLCRNHMMMTLLLPALSRLGVRVKLMNTDMASSKMTDLAINNKLDLLIYDSEFREKIPNDLPCKTSQSVTLYNEIMDRDLRWSLPRINRGGEISVFTGGSSVKSKEATRRMNVTQFLPPLNALLKELRLDEYTSVFLSLPVYHGFGLATLVMSFLMGKKVCLMNHFDAEKALKIIDEEEIEVLPVVPAMLARLWQIDEAPALMKTVKCIISGGDRLDKKWVDVTTEHLGNVLFNLFGTTETGFFIIASPEDLSRNEEVTIGRPIRGVKCKLQNVDNHGVGSLWVRSGWAMMGLKNKWHDTGDLVYRDSEGCYFYRGRSDNMVVCGGENVFPENVEKVINSHTDVLNSVVYPVTDPQFGTVLNAKVELKPDSTLTSETIKEKLRPQLSRAEMPHHISIEPITTSATGKLKRN